MYFDTSQVGFGCVFMQHGNVIKYVPTQIKAYKKNYPTHDLELANIVFDIKIWRHYVYEVHVDVLTYNKRLQYILTQKRYTSI